MVGPLPFLHRVIYQPRCPVVRLLPKVLLRGRNPRRRAKWCRSSHPHRVRPAKAGLSLFREVRLDANLVPILSRAISPALAERATPFPIAMRGRAVSARARPSGRERRPTPEGRRGPMLIVHPGSPWKRPRAPGLASIRQRARSFA